MVVQNSREVGLPRARQQARLLNVLGPLSLSLKYGNRILAGLVNDHLTAVLAETTFVDGTVNPFDFLKALLDGRRGLFEGIVGTDANLSPTAIQERLDAVDQCARTFVSDLRSRLINKNVRTDSGRAFFTAFDAMLIQVLKELPVSCVDANSPGVPSRVRVFIPSTLRPNQNAWSELLRRTQSNINGTVDVVNQAYAQDPGAFFQYFSVGL